MASSSLDWGILKGSVILLTASTLLSSSLVAGSYYFQKRMLLEYNVNNAQFQSISARYLAVDEEEKLIKKYFPQFIELYNAGVLGREKRLNWLEVLNNAGKDIRLPALSYDIASQKNHVPGFQAVMGRYKMFSSNMKLKMQILHEGDLFRLFQVLDEMADGLYSVSECELLRVFSMLDDNIDKGNISAVCELEWYSIKLADGSEIKI